MCRLCKIETIKKDRKNRKTQDWREEKEYIFCPVCGYITKSFIIEADGMCTSCNRLSRKNFNDDPKSSDNVITSGEWPEEKTVGNTNLINPFADFDDDDDEDDEW